MSMVKRATGKIENFTSAEGEEVTANVVWADEKKVDSETPKIKDELVVPMTTEMDLDPNAVDDDDTVIAKDC